MDIEAIEFEDSAEALRYAESTGGIAILMEAKYLVVSCDDAQSLVTDGVEVAYLYDEECSDGRTRILTITVN